MKGGTCTSVTTSAAEVQTRKSEPRECRRTRASAQARGRVGGRAYARADWLPGGRAGIDWSSGRYRRYLPHCTVGEATLYLPKSIYAKTIKTCAGKERDSACTGDNLVTNTCVRSNSLKQIKLPWLSSSTVSYDILTNLLKTSNCASGISNKNAYNPGFPRHY